MKELKVSIGEQVIFAKTVSESDVYMFAGITGDYSVNHINEEYMKKTLYGKPSSTAHSLSASYRPPRPC